MCTTSLSVSHKNARIRAGEVLLLPYYYYYYYVLLCLFVVIVYLLPALRVLPSREKTPISEKIDV